jgi:UrcA family protein
VTHVTAAKLGLPYTLLIDTAPRAKPEETEMNAKTFLIAAAALSLSAGAVHAETQPSMTVKVSDLDLNQPKDVQRLYDRVYEAATIVCGGGPLRTFLMGPSREYTSCRDTVVNTALGQFHAPMVMALRAKLNGQDQLAAN